MFKILISILFSLSFAFSAPLSVADAFGLTHKVDDNNVEFSFKLAENIYVFKDSLNVISNGKNLNEFLNLPSYENDGTQDIYKQGFTIFVPIKLLREINVNDDFKINLQYQGCAKDGICYQPQNNEYLVKNGVLGYSITHLDKKGNAQTSTNQNSADLSEQDQIAQNLQTSNFLLSLLSFFGYGILLSLTPCVFPMIPILSSIIVAKSGEKKSVKKGFLLSLIYVFGMSVAYALAGILASIFGGSLQVMLQTPAVLVGFSVVFVILALSMFGLYDIELPAKIQNFLNKKSQSKDGLLGVFLMGFLAALIASPCVAAPLAGALLYIANSGNIILGGAALFSMGLGMGLLLLIIGTSSGKFLPRPGIWMENVKKFFGFIMIFMAIWLSSKVFGETTSLRLYGVVGIFMAVFFGAFDTTDESSTSLKKLFKAAFILLFVYSNLLIIGSFLGSKSLLNPLENFSSKAVEKSELGFVNVRNLSELKKAISGSQKPVLIDFFATWCVSCVELDEITFADKSVQNRINSFTLLRVDVTKGTSDDDEILKHFGLIGPPAILFFKNGDEVKNARLIGFYPPDKFLNHLDKFKF